MSMKYTTYFVFLLVILCGCGPSAEQVAEQKARQDFRLAVAAMKVCTQGATYTEFREKRMALETYYTANSIAITNASAFVNLDEMLQATDVLWNYKLSGNVEITSQYYINLIAIHQERMGGISALHRVIPARTATGQLLQNQQTAKAQLDYLEEAQAKFRKSPDYLAGNPEAKAAYDIMFDDIKEEPLPAGCRSSKWNTPIWEAMLTIRPKVSHKFNFTLDQCRQDPDFKVQSYIEEGLLSISIQCDKLLQN
jgi:hypothetical protein